MQKWEFIVVIKSQRYLSTFCPTTKLHTPGIFLKTVLYKLIIFFKLGYIYHINYLHISEVNELHKIMLQNE